ncbi:diaminopimelate decarboxylase [mine drainage metagenome]|uniref:Diaminopimelate decarboxylase n=1 Tax=mine drainage metagenome TaxID=410659 RepID=A0A1J5QRN2_9ZZZZ
MEVPGKLSEKIWPHGTYRDGDGIVCIGEIRATDLAKEFGTPLFVLDENDFRARARNWRASFEDAFGVGNVSVYYAGKAFISIAVAKWVDQEGLGLDVCTGGEFAIATAAQFPTSRIAYHGNNKSESEIHDAVTAGVGLIVVDSFYELERVAREALAAGVVQTILLRVTPGVDAHTHEFIATAHEDVKFGFSISTGAAAEAARLALASPHLELRGLHSHIGSQIFDTEGFEVAAHRVIALLAAIRDEHGVALESLDLGGGYGIAYVESDDPLSPDAISQSLFEIVKTECDAHDLEIPHISIEPGRAVVGPSTVTLYTVGTVKAVELDGGRSRSYISVDGGMSDNIRTALYDAEYTAVLANRLSTAAPFLSRVVGKHCESGDIVVRDTDLPSDIAPGDLIATPATGAYGRSMASNYNHLTRPPVVAVYNGKARVIVRRETHEDLMRLEVEG